MLIGPLPLGHPVGALAATMPVGTEVTVVEPIELRAVTRMRNVVPTSDCRSVYVLPVAPLMFSQLPPVRLQLRHWKLNVIVGVPDQKPGSAVSVSPSTGLPPMVGGCSS